MRGAKRLSILSAITIGAGALLGVPAAAADEIPAEVAVTSSEVDSISAKETTTVGTTGTGVPAIKCRAYTTTKTAKNNFGSTMFKFHQKVTWCYNGKKITSASSKAWADSLAAGWNYKGLQSTETSGGAGKSSYTAWRQGKFCLVVPGTGERCISEKRPWIEQKVTKTGGHSSSTGM
ncbi:hypothetical protein SAMN05444920_13843 [Nonomuraea solani]|uniref:Secreted protein n=1 Tax=Nonomuraea solani TaxID=1144553 RepID=A0A1H6F075_9ACTN|nr:hypothetical protein [Nonomuraea solani]SEH03540.1 hypothetical protein SAMN05444920_13843 [Nonomuraea solani]